MARGNPRVWSPEEIQWLEENFHNTTRKEKMLHLECTVGELEAKTRTLGLKKFGGKKWSDNEIQFLKDNVPTKGVVWSSEQLGRPLHGAYKMAEKLGLKRDWEYKYIDSQGYVVLCHDRNNKVYEHRKVMEDRLGRPLLPEELVHHIDGNKQNNSPENLELTTRAEHINIHREDLERAKR